MKVPQWSSITAELGTRFSIIPIKTEVMVVKSTTPGSCAHCVMSPLHPLGYMARDKRVRCGSLPLCDDKVFLPTDKVSMTKYTAARLTE